MLNLTPQTLIQRIDDHIAEAEFENTVVLFHIENGVYYNLNSTATSLWKKLYSPQILIELISFITMQYLCTLEQAQADLISWLHDLNTKGLIQII